MDFEFISIFIRLKIGIESGLAFEFFVGVGGLKLTILLL